VRIAAKKLRYKIEVLAPHMGAGAKPLLQRLRTFQDSLGGFHDDSVLDSTLRAAIDHAVDHGQSHLARQLRGIQIRLQPEIADKELAARSAVVALREANFVDEVRAALLGIPVEEPDDAAVSHEPAATDRRSEHASDPKTDDAAPDGAAMSGGWR
jgi:hypothetical protein